MTYEEIKEGLMKIDKYLDGLKIGDEWYKTVMTTYDEEFFKVEISSTHNSDKLGIKKTFESSDSDVIINVISEWFSKEV